MITKEDTKKLYEYALAQVKDAWNRGIFNDFFRLSTDEKGNGIPDFSFDDYRWKGRGPHMELEIDKDGDIQAHIWISPNCGCCPPDEYYYDIELEK